MNPEIQNLLDKMHNLDSLISDAVKQAHRRGFEEGLASTLKPPSDVQFRKDHKEPQMYGEELAHVVYARTKKQAANLLEADEEFVEEIGISWYPYEYEGEWQVGYYIGAGEPRWTLYGVWC